MRFWNSVVYSFEPVVLGFWLRFCLPGSLGINQALRKEQSFKSRIRFSRPPETPNTSRSLLIASVIRVPVVGSLVGVVRGVCLQRASILPSIPFWAEPTLGDKGQDLTQPL